MISDTIVDEYPLLLSTGEVIQICEIDDERSPALADDIVRTLCSGLLDHCTRVSRAVMEEAKGGYDSSFKKALRSGPLGCMAKGTPPVCRLINDCAMADPQICTLRNISGLSAYRAPRPLPICWEFSPIINVPLPQHEEQVMAAISLGAAIGDAWRRGKYVVTVING